MKTPLEALTQTDLRRLGELARERLAEQYRAGQQPSADLHRIAALIEAEQGHVEGGGREG